MKSLMEYSLGLPEQAYHDYPAWSHSMIARYAREGFSCIPFIHDKIEPTASMKFGTLFDTAITRDPKELDAYTVMDVTVPDAERKALDYISTQTNLTLDKISEEDLMRWCDDIQYQGRWKYSARYEHLAQYTAYYNAKRSGKEIVSQKDWNDAMEMRQIFRGDKYLQTLFGVKNSKDISYLYQPQFVVTMQISEKHRARVKFMLDLLIVDRANKTLRPVDLKTSSQPAHQFKDNFLKFRYDLEAAVYTDGLQVLINGIPEYADYTILPFLFTDISRSDKTPVTYEYDPREESQINGLHYFSGDKEYQYKHWMTLLDEIITYEETNAKVPSYIKTDGPNNMLNILEK